MPIGIAASQKALLAMTGVCVEGRLSSRAERGDPGTYTRKWGVLVEIAASQKTLLAMTVILVIYYEII